MTTLDDKTLDMIVFNARQVAVAMSGEYAELAASADDYRTMADVIAALRERIAALEKDAERWRAVHELDGDQMDAFVVAHWINPEALNATIDAAIDAARAALKEPK